MDMRVGFYAGSFDPFTIGHLNLVKKASLLFDKVIVGMGVNPKKTRTFSKIEMKDAINELFKNEGLDNCECIIYEGLTVDAAKEYNTTYLIRGIRNGMDYDFEENLALVNEEISELDTIYIRAGAYGAISSSMVKELMLNNKEASKYLPKEIFKLIK
jgi:pantetheine-phosphate adenylyltransferase